MISILFIQQQGKKKKLKTGKTKKIKKYNFSSNFSQIEWETSVFRIRRGVGLVEVTLF